MSPKLNCFAVGDFPKFPRCYKAISVTNLLPTAGSRLIQREHEQVARVREIIVLDRMQVSAAALHREKLLGADRVGHRRALERRAEVEAPQLLQRLVVI